METETGGNSGICAFQVLHFFESDAGPRQAMKGNPGKKVGELCSIICTDARKISISSFVKNVDNVKKACKMAFIGCRGIQP